MARTGCIPQYSQRVKDKCAELHGCATKGASGETKGGPGETNGASGETKATVRETAPDPGELRYLPIKDLIPTPDNVRTVRPDDPKVKEMAESMRKVGVLQPVCARPHPSKPGKYDLRFGARRHMAAGLAGLATIPTIVREMDDLTAMVVTVTENMEREDLSAMEESRAVQQLIEAGFSIQDTAAKLGKSPAFVARRAALSRLAKCWRDLAEKDPRFMRWPAAYWEKLAPLPAEVQQKLCGDNEWDQDEIAREVRKASDLDRMIANHTSELKRAKFALDDPALVAKAGACSECQKRSSCQPGLFDIGFDADPKEIKAKDRCLDSTCWDQKIEAHIERRKAELAAEHGKCLVTGSGPGRVYEYTLDRCKKDAPGATPVLDESGELFWAKTQREERKSSSSGSSGGGSGAGSANPGYRKELAEAFACARLAQVIAGQRLDEIDAALSVGLAACAAHRLAAGTLNHHMGTREARTWLEGELGLRSRNGGSSTPQKLIELRSAGDLFMAAGALAYFDQANPTTHYTKRKPDWVPEPGAALRKEAAEGFVITEEFLDRHLRADLARVAKDLGLPAGSGLTKSEAINAILDAKLPAGSLTQDLAKAFGVKYSNPKVAKPAKPAKKPAAKKAKASKAEAAG